MKKKPPTSSWHPGEAEPFQKFHPRPRLNIKSIFNTDHRAFLFVLRELSSMRNKGSIHTLTEAVHVGRFLAAAACDVISKKLTPVGSLTVPFDATAAWRRSRQSPMKEEEDEHGPKNATVRRSKCLAQSTIFKPYSCVMPFYAVFLLTSVVTSY